MKILTILGGPRVDGNTDRILDWAERALREWGHDVERVNLAERDVRGCKSCFACTEEPEQPGCVLSDDGPEIFGKMVAADALLFATPLYMWGVASQLKALLDRSICLVRGYGSPDYRSFVDAKPIVLLVSCAGPVEGNAELVQESFARYAAYTKLDSRGAFVFPHCTDVNMLPNTHGKQARALAAALVGRD